MNDALKLLAGLTLENGQKWGDAAQSWQWEDAEAILGDDGPRMHYITRPRGGSKTTDLGGICLAALLTQMPAGSWAYAYAVDQGQAALLLDAIAGFADRDRLGDVQVDARRVLSKTSGAAARIEASDDASAWGTRGQLYIVDEFAQWKTTHGPRRLFEAIVSAVPKTVGCRMVILTTAGDPAHPSAAMIAKAREAPGVWRVHEVPGPCPWIESKALEEQRRLLPESQYRRLHLNQWVAAEDRLVSEDDLRACVTLDGPLEPKRGVRYRIGVDVGLKHDRTAVAVCHGDEHKVFLDRLLVWQGTRSSPVQLELVEAAILQAARQYNGAKVVIDPWQAVGSAQRLRREGVSVEEYPFSAQSVGRLAVKLYRLLKDHALALPDDPELLDELLNVRLRETSPGVYRIDHDPDKHDDRAIALALAAQRSASASGYAVSSAGRSL